MTAAQEEALVKEQAESGFSPNSEYGEAYRTARANIVFSLMINGCKKVAVSSPKSGEGKTTTAMNLAYMLAYQMDTRVLLIDCDLRKPQIHEYFHCECTPGLTNYLIKECSIDDLLRQQNDAPGLSVAFGGRMAPNPAEILASPLFSTFLEEMESEYDYIIMDTPPVNAVTDGLSVIKLCDGVVLSVVQGFSLHSELSRTIHIISGIGAKILGAVIHGVEKKRNGGYGYP
ncbi:MAG: CpsD/CapB family tyrosine-protein kinase [Clostridiales bacterium]|jgi:capsular exopolysaccharide synthesis family protein|nr:CpsD/CapB family tyrosine-protein kinase [Clostridiales bacterium]